MTKDELEKARELMRDLERFLDKYTPEEKTEDTHQDIQGKFIAAEWEKKAIKSKLTNLLIAPEDYYELNDNAEGTEKKEYFTWEEAMALEKKVSNGWRLPTRHEWALICEEFANDEHGELSSEMLRESLALSLSGYVTDGGNLNNVGLSGNFWSSTAYGSDLAYYLFVDSSAGNPQCYSSMSYWLAVRMVKELPDE